MLHEEAADQIVVVAQSLRARRRGREQKARVLQATARQHEAAAAGGCRLARQGADLEAVDDGAVGAVTMPVRLALSSTVTFVAARSASR